MQVFTNISAQCLAAGLLGIENGNSLQPMVEGPSEDDPELPKLPKTLESALLDLASDTSMRSLLGEEFVNLFTTVKQFELARFHNHVTDWEQREYMEIY